MTEEKLAEIQKRCEAAAPEPWWRGPDGVNYKHGILIHDYNFDCLEEADAEFISHARQDVPALLAEVRRLQAILAEIDKVAYGSDPNPDVSSWFNRLRIVRDILYREALAR